MDEQVGPIIEVVKTIDDTNEYMVISKEGLLFIKIFKID
jgi:hypothetical protein